MKEYRVEPTKISFDLNPPLERNYISRHLKAVKKEEIKGYLRQGRRLGAGLVETQGTYAIYENKQELVEDQDFPDPLKEADLLAFGISTIGPALENKVDRLMEEGNCTFSYILDSIGSGWLKKTSHLLADKMVEFARVNDLKTTRAFQPGSSTSQWRIENQQLIFDHLDSEALEVRLSPSFTMIPKKSNSFVLGLGQKVKNENELFSCKGCGKTNCNYKLARR